MKKSSSPFILVPRNTPKSTACLCTMNGLGVGLSSSFCLRACSSLPMNSSSRISSATLCAFVQFSRLTITLPSASSSCVQYSAPRSLILATFVSIFQLFCHSSAVIASLIICSSTSSNVTIFFSLLAVSTSQSSPYLALQVVNSLSITSLSLPAAL